MVEQDDFKDKRRHPRQDILGITIDINNGYKLFNYCDVSNISTGGLRVDNIRNRIIDYPCNNDAIYDAIVTYKNEIIRVVISPRWIHSVSISPYVSIGFEIIKNYQKWYDFVRRHSQLQPKLSEDIWGIAGHKYLKR